MTFTAIGTFVLVLSLVAIFVMVLVARQQRTGRDTAIWAIAGLVGVLLGAAGSAAVVQLMNYELTVRIPQDERITASDADKDFVNRMGSTTPAGSAGDPTDSGKAAGGPPSGGPGAAGGPPGGGPGGGPPGFGPPPPRRQLTTLVRKLELLTGDVAITLTDEQKTSLATLLDELNSAETLTDEQAQEKMDQILAVLDEQQKAKEQAIGLPFRRGGGGPGGGGDGDANPFRGDEASGQALETLRVRISGATPVDP